MDDLRHNIARVLHRFTRGTVNFATYFLHEFALCGDGWYGERFGVLIEILGELPTLHDSQGESISGELLARDERREDDEQRIASYSRFEVGLTAVTSATRSDDIDWIAGCCQAFGSI